ncbi:hypothetical protein GCM10010353_27380 [Streptomyces chryseus]|nr:hypothetical protein GCM10010353_27380 [Streptomyces chryseus]
MHPGTGDLRTDTDVTVRVAHGTDILAEADTVIVPASDEDCTPRVAPCLPPALAKALHRIRPGARVASICTGSFVLAAAGLLDGKRATTHWRSAADLQRLHPRVRVDPDVLYTDDDGVLTAAGVASGIDLCLHMIRADHGSRVANEVARGTVVPPHRDGGQAAVGFGTAVSLRQHLHAALGVSPSAYRATFRGAGDPGARR